MLCFHCKEQIEVGEAMKEQVIANHPRVFHPNCFNLYKEKVIKHYQTELQLVQSHL